MNHDNLEIDDLLRDIQRDYLADTPKEEDNLAENLDAILEEFGVDSESESAEPKKSTEDEFLSMFSNEDCTEVGVVKSEEAPVQPEASESEESADSKSTAQSEAASEAAASAPELKIAETASPEDGLPETEPADALPEEEEKPSLLKRLLPKKKEKEAGEPESEEDELPAYVTVLHDVVFLMAIIMAIFVFIVRLVGVKGSSMVPTLYEGDRVVLLSNFLSDDYKAGDVVVLIAPDYDENTPLIKRVIATEGQTVNINFASGKVYVDGELLEETYIAEATTYNPGGITYPVEVPEGCIFVMGDNRNHSTDSRNVKVGFVETENVLGKVLFRLFHSKSAETAANG